MFFCYTKNYFTIHCSVDMNLHWENFLISDFFIYECLLILLSILIRQLRIESYHAFGINEIISFVTPDFLYVKILFQSIIIFTHVSLTIDVYYRYHSVEILSMTKFYSVFSQSYNFHYSSSLPACIIFICFKYFVWN